MLSGSGLKLAGTSRTRNGVTPSSSSATALLGT